VRRVLITGMSGTRKSSLIAELAALGYKAVDTDAGWCEPQPDGRQRWREDAIQALLATEDTDVLFVAGCEENQVRFHSQFDRIILLSAPLEVLTQRLATRTNNPFGKSAEESAGSWQTSRKSNRCCGQSQTARSTPRCRSARYCGRPCKRPVPSRPPDCPARCPQRT
jgi:dephospho-CoA kinase